MVDQIANQNKRLDIVNSHLADLEPLFRKGFLRKEVLLNQQIEQTLVQSQISNLRGPGRTPTAGHGRSRRQAR